MITKEFFVVCVLVFNMSCYTRTNFLEEDDGDVLEYKKTPPITYVKSKYEHTWEGIDYLWYPAQNPKKLWILCNGATVDRYTMWSWFWDSNEVWEDTSYLFLKDDDIRWYLGTKDRPLTQVYCDLITHIMKESGLSAENVMMIGHSMGGYAALHLGLRLGVKGIVALRAQTNWQINSTYFSIKKLADVWVDIDKLIEDLNYIPLMYLQFGEFQADKDAGEICVDALLKKRSFIIVEKTLNTNHTGYHPTKEYLTYIVDSLYNRPIDTKDK